MILTHRLDSQERKAIDDRNELKPLLPGDVKRSNKTRMKMADLALQIKNATIHMYRPWESEITCAGTSGSASLNSNTKTQSVDYGEEYYDENCDSDSILEKSRQTASSSTKNIQSDDNSQISYHSPRHESEAASSSSLPRSLPRSSSSVPHVESESRSPTHLSVLVNEMTERVRSSRKTLDLVSDAVGMIEVSQDWVEKRKIHNISGKSQQNHYGGFRSSSTEDCNYSDGTSYRISGSSSSGESKERSSRGDTEECSLMNLFTKLDLTASSSAIKMKAKNINTKKTSNRIDVFRLLKSEICIS